MRDTWARWMVVMWRDSNRARGQVVGRSSQNKTVNFTVRQAILPAVGSYPMVRITETFPIVWWARLWRVEEVA